MKNFYASNSAHAIPYRPELKLCFEPFPVDRGSRKEMTTSGAVLLQQLDYWFAKYPKGFYKFLEPPSTENRAYKPGDSWTEELCFSRREFTTAFEQIGIAYKSKKAFHDAERSGDVFQGRFYCSYYDRITHVTWYYRNHAVVDSYLDRVTQTAVKGQSESGKKQLPNGASAKCVNDETAFTVNDGSSITEMTDRTFDLYTETTNRDYTQKLTATTSLCEGSGDNVRPLASQGEDSALRYEAKDCAETVVALMRENGLHVTVTNTLINACQGKRLTKAALNAIAVIEKAKEQPIRQPQGALTKALQDDWAPSLGFFRKKLSEPLRKVYVEEFLLAGRALGYIKRWEFSSLNYMWESADGEIMIVEYVALPWINGNECSLGALWDELKYLNEVA